MKTTNKITHTVRQQMIRHGFSQAERLTDIYKQFHNSKWPIMNRAREIYHMMRGFDFRIIGYNSQTFSCGFYYIDNTNDYHFVYVTRDNIYDTNIGGKENCISCCTIKSTSSKSINLVKEKNRKNRDNKKMYTLDDFFEGGIENEREH